MADSTLEHGDAQPLRPATPEFPIPDPLGRGNHALPGFVEVADDAARDVMKATLISQADPLDPFRIVVQTGGLFPLSMWAWDAVNADFWFVGSFTKNLLTTLFSDHGWIRVTDVGVQGTGTVTDKVFDDPGQDTILESATVSEDTIVVSVEASYPNVLIGGSAGVLPKVGDIYKGSVNVTVVPPGPVTVTSQVIHPDGQPSGSDDITVTVDAPPQILTVTFVAQGGGAGGAATYPGAQTELKAGDQVRIEGTTDKLADAIVVSDLGAGVSETIPFTAATSFSILITVADRGTTVQDLAATVAARDATTAAVGAAQATSVDGGAVDGVGLVKLNNLFPGIVFGAITYPATQFALKGAETASVPNALTDFDTVLYDDPTAAELTIPSPTVAADPKVVTRLGGTYNVTVPNFRVTATRAANAAVTVDELVVSIADVAAQLTVTEPATRLRSGGNDGTAVQDHTITITSNQDLIGVPTLAPDGGGGDRGTFPGAFAGGPTVFTSALRVDETVPSLKGVFAWGAIAGTNLAGIVTSVITGDAAYELGGFVQRTKTFAPFAPTVQIGTEIVDYAKFQAGVFTSTGGAALKQAVGTTAPPSVTNGFAGDAVSVNPTTIEWLDVLARDANSSGTAQLTDIEETV